MGTVNYVNLTHTGESTGGARLPFELNFSVDVFQEKMDLVFEELEGVTGIADDTFVSGVSEADHDQHIINVLVTARQNNVRLNPDRFQFKVSEASSDLPGHLMVSRLTLRK